jgi:hypothetical protein
MLWINVLNQNLREDPMLAPSSSLTEIYAHFVSLNSAHAGVKTLLSLEEIQAKLESTQTIEEKFPLYLAMFESRLVDILTTRNAMCKTYKVLQEVENSPNKLFSLYKMEIELVIEQFATAFYMQIGSEIGNNTRSLTDVRGVYLMLTQDLKELRMEIQRHCVVKNYHSSFNHSEKRQNVHLKLEQVSSN